MFKRWKVWLAALGVASLAACGGSDNPPPAVPDAPASLSVEPGDAVNTVQWPAVVDATTYTLYWSETTPVDVATAQSVTNAVSPYKHAGRTNGTHYYYVVTSGNANGQSLASAEVGAMPVAPVPSRPTSLAATPGDTTLTLDWSAVSRADSYNVYWSTSAGVVPGAAGVTKLENIRDTSFTLVGLSNLVTYHAVVTAVSTGGEGKPSQEASAMPLPPAPGAPANVKATAGDARVQLSWSPSTGATSYNVYWSNSANVVPGAGGVSLISGVTSTSHQHGSLNNGTRYHYVVSAVGPGGESATSSEASALPLPPPPPAPLGLTAIAPKDVVSVTVQWFDITDYPTAASPIQLGYHLYRGLEPGLAGYYKDSSRATKIADVTAPFTDASVSRATTYYYVVTAHVPGFPGVESEPSGEVSVTTGRAGGPGGGDTGETGFGNNLSVPLVFADAVGLTGAKITGTWPGAGPFASVPAFDFNTSVRPLSTETLATFPFLDSNTAVSIGGVTYYPQGSSSTWQAEWRSNSAGSPVETVVDWGDALISRTFTTSSMVRVETTLLQDASIPGVSDTMTAYRMALLSGSMNTELRGTDGTTFASTERNVFTVHARLKIEKIGSGGNPDIVIFDKAIHEGLGSEHGPGDAGGGAPTASSYTAEMNMAGAIVYGYNFRLGSIAGIGDKTGQYRITFSLDPTATVEGAALPNRVRMVSKKDALATLAPNGLSSSVVITVN